MVNLHPLDIALRGGLVASRLGQEGFFKAELGGFFQAWFGLADGADFAGKTDFAENHRMSRNRLAGKR